MGWTPWRSSVGVEADLFRGHGLDLDDFLRLMLLDEREDDAVGFGGVRGPVHMTASAGTVFFELGEVVVEVAQGVGADLGAGLAQVLPVGEFGGDFVALALNNVGGVADIAAGL